MTSTSSPSTRHSNTAIGVSHGSTHGFAGAHVEAAAVQRADDLEAFDVTVRQARKRVGADVVGREDAAIDEVERELARPDLHAGGIFRLELGSAATLCQSRS